jgi:5,10-methenyltetrahydrofolate synthetase
VKTDPDWRKSERRRLIAEREAVAPSQRAAWAQHIDAHLQRGFPQLAQACVAFCWPYRGEYDARNLVRQLHQAGARIALPVVVASGSPLLFRQWTPDTPLLSGPLDIPYPGAQSPQLQPSHVLLPVVGIDAAGYRLGYGGGYFDRTLAALAATGLATGLATGIGTGLATDLATPEPSKSAPLVIATGYELCRIPSIDPQPHDIPMDWLVTERGLYRREAGRLVFQDLP